MHSNRNKKRIGIDIVLFLSVFLLPWWVTLLATLVATFLIHSFFESLVVGVLLDVLYGVPSTSFIKSFPFSLGFSFLFLISFWAREQFFLSNRP
jgi:hypothetical protein